MALSAQSRLGPYEILSPIGAGGMGEVYKARDTRLERTVAVKVLPERLSASTESRQRFEREAKTISQLSHPHICALYDVGSERDLEFLVMEYLEGETLTERLMKGALPLEQTLRFGQQIADALDKAHRQGIVHRDLKPSNVMLTKSGVKLLDFGLAKTFERSLDASGREQAAAEKDPMARSSLTALPTVTGNPNLTEAGTILGTFQYMAPEQLEGKEADARTDLFAFGATLYEMATGRKAFSGSSQASLISAIMKEDPAPISAVQPMSPPALDRVVRTCLAKDPEDRWQSAHDVASELKWIAEGSQAGVPAKVAWKRRNRERLAWVAAVLATALAAYLVAGRSRLRQQPEPLVRSALVLPQKLFIGDVAVSPNGRRVAFSMRKPGSRFALWIRDLDADAPRPIPGAEDVTFPFWSPDSRTIAFFAPRKLQSVNPDDGALVTICEAEQGVGGTWGSDGTIVFAPGGTSALYRVPAAGGEPVAVTKLQPSRHEVAHRYPWFLPDGEHFLYFATDLGETAAKGSNSIRVGSVDGRTDKSLVDVVSNAQFAAGQLLYVREGSLVARPLDPERLEFRGDAVPLAPLQERASDWTAFYTFSASDRLLIMPPMFAPPSRLTWFDRSGRSQGSIGDANRFAALRLSPDERKVAVEVVEPSKDVSEIWIYDVASGLGSKVIFEPYSNEMMAWSPDGKRLYFGSDRRLRGARQDLWVDDLDEAKEQALIENGDQHAPMDVSRDGRFLLLRKIPLKERHYQLWAAETSDPKRQTQLSAGLWDHFNARLSPDGRWLAYDSDESGASEIYVQPFPGHGGKWKVSMGGGISPRWRGDGREIFYLTAEFKVMAVPVTMSPAFQAGPPAVLFERINNGWDVASDGQRFLINTLPEEAGSPPMNLLLNWTALTAKAAATR